MKTLAKQLKVKRHELKYYLSHSDYEYARGLLRELMQRDEHSPERGYPLRSLYLDDIGESGVVEKLDGVLFRDKYRLRSYGKEYDWLKLERKRKHDNIIDKTSVTLSTKQAKRLLNGDHDVLLEMGTAGARALYFDFKRKYLRPVVVIDYIREAYTLPYNNVRITFDKELRTSTDSLDIFDDNLETNKVQREDTIIMEVKYNVALPSWFKDFFHFDSATSSAISKYTQGRIGQMDSWWGLENY
jgi:hypothetical protein